MHCVNCPLICCSLQKFLSTDKNMLLSYTSEMMYECRFEGRRELPLPLPRFERGPPDGPLDGVRPAGPLPAPPVAWSRSSEDWKDPWLR